MGLLQPDGGQILLDGVDVTRMPAFQRARLGMGYLPQKPSIFRGLTVEQNIMLMLEMHEPDRDMRRRRADELLHDFGLGPLRRARATTLSGGERRRCEIARALASNPDFILLDEPFAGVDPIAVKEIRVIVAFLASQGIGILITDHNVRETLALVDYAYIIDAGRVLSRGAPETVLQDPAVRNAYLGEHFRL
jgi:lipopolysaccharide export system ATP-binding protein